MTRLDRVIGTAAEMERLGAQMAAQIKNLTLVTLHGPLGAGKTTLVRGLLRGLGHSGAVKSPTFTLVEPYSFAGVDLYHFDLYRLIDPQELAFLGLRDYLDGKGVCVVEWADRAQGVLPLPDVDIMITPIETGRMVQITTLTREAESWLQALK